MVGKLDLKKLRVPDLREQLASRGLDTAGTKSVLMERLERALETTAQPAAQQKLVGNSNAAGNPEEEGVNAGATGPSLLAKKQSAGFKAKKSAGQQSAAGARFAGQGAPEKENGTEADGANAKLASNLKGSGASPAGQDKAGTSKHQAIVFSSSGSTELKLMPVAPLVSTASVDAQPTEADKRKERAKRFGTFDSNLEADKKKERAARFGIPTPEGEEEKKKARAKRFGIPTPELEEQKKKDRARRFGIITKEQEEEKKQKRAKRFGIVTPEGEENKKKARAARFGLSAPTSGLSEAEKMKKRAQRFGE